MRPQALALSPDGRLLVTAGKTHDLVVHRPAVREDPPARAAAVGEATRTPRPTRSPTTSSSRTRRASSVSPGWSFRPTARASTWRTSTAASRSSASRRAARWLACSPCRCRRPTPRAARRKSPPASPCPADGKRLYVALNLRTPGRTGRRHRQGAAALGRGRRALRRGAGRAQGLRQQLGRAAARTPTASPARPGAARSSAWTRCATSPAKARCRSSTWTQAAIRSPKPEVRNPDRPARLGPGLSPERPLARGRQCRQRHPQRDRHAHAIRSSKPSGRGKTRRTCSAPAQRAGVRPVRQDGSSSATAPRTPSPSFDFSPGKSQLLGLIPVGWFPGAVVHDPRRNALYVANIKGIGSTRTLEPDKDAGVQLAPVSRHAFAGEGALGARAGRVTRASRSRNMRYPLLRQAALPPRPGQPPRPVPERVGEPSVFKHVVYIIKENRTYDQVLGDMTEGNGDPSLCIFGERITPNQHKLAREFVLLDNTYCSGILSADGHQWADTAIATDYMETLLRRLPAQLPGRHGGRRRGRAGLLARRDSSGTTPSRTARRCATTASSPSPKRAGRTRRRKARPSSSITTAISSTRPAQIDIRSRPGDRVAAAVPVHQHRGLGHGHSGCVPRRAVHQRTEAVRADAASFPNLTHHLPAQRPHQRHQGRLAHARRPGGRQRPRLRPDRRGHQPQPVLAGDLHLRHRGRSAERLGPRQRLSHHGLRRQPLHPARRGGQHAVQPDQPPAHDGADPRPAADEPARRHRHADVRLLHQHAGPHALHRRCPTTSRWTR